MLWEAARFIEDAVQEDPDIEIYWEWPHNCLGWKQNPVVHISKIMEKFGFDWLPCRVDGCCYSMKDAHGDFLLKKWRIYTNSEQFHQAFKCKLCPQNHSHGRIEGVETAKSSYYPWKFVQSVCKFWASQMASKRQFRTLFQHHCDDIDDEEDDDFILAADTRAITSSSTSPLPSSTVPSEDEKKRWQLKLQHFHRASGHAPPRSIARIVRDAGLEPWKVKMAEDFQCPICLSLRPGGISSGQVPPAATHAQFGPWEAVCMDVSEWIVPNTGKKLKFLLMMDCATRLRSVVPLMPAYDISIMKTESAEMLVQAVASHWLAIYPKPLHFVTDSGSSFTATKFGNFCADAGVDLTFSAEKESWAHGMAEHGMKDLKHTASAIQIDCPDLEPEVTLTLAASSLNSTEYVSGYTSHQWAFGRDYSIGDEDRRVHALHSDRSTFANIVAARQRAEEVAIQTRSKRILSKLGNSKARQPIKTFKVTELVKIWRKVLPQDVHSGPRGGFKRASKPGWIGPGRVIFAEVLPHQPEGDVRRHIVWVLMQGKLFRCSVHSVRSLTPTERLHHEVHHQEDPSAWKTLSDLMPAREFTDITHEVPDEDELEQQLLPPQPDPMVKVPVQRIQGKSTLQPSDWKTVHRSSPIGIGNQSSSVRGPGFLPRPTGLSTSPPGLGDKSSTAPGLVAGTEDPSAAASSSSPSPQDPSHVVDLTAEPVNVYEPPPREGAPHLPEPEPKKPRTDAYDLKWVEALEHDAALEASHMDFFQALQSNEEILAVTIDVNLSSQKQRKDFVRNANAFLVRKLANSEVNLKRLSECDQELFRRAKLKEVDSFLKNEAVRRCLDDAEIKRAYSTKRIIRARWVLTWKAIPPDEADEAREDQQTNPQSTVNAQGNKKAKARIVLLGFQHPSLLDPSFKTSAPVQSMVGRNMIYLLAVQHQWRLRGLDLATAFLQTQPTKADEEL